MAGREGRPRTETRRSRRWSASVAVAGGVALTFTASSRPGALLFRYLLESSPTTTLRRRPNPDVESISNEQYEPDESDARLDVYFPASTSPRERLPTVIWIHGGAWISGHKEDAASYFETLAAGGFTVIAVEYSRAPGARYPTPIRQINAAVAYVRLHAARFHVDDERIVLAGESAGAQISSQIAALVTNPDYAAELGVVPSLRPQQLRGVILFCGAFDVSAHARHQRALPNAALRLFVRSVLWAYTGSRDRYSPTLRQMSTIDHVTVEFPPTFISGGNADPLTDVHSRPFAARLAELGVDVTPLFYASDHTPALGHEYHFQIDDPEGHAALEAVLAYLRRCTQ